MVRWKSKLLGRKNEKRVFNAFSGQRFFDHEFHKPDISSLHVTLDKLSVIDEIISTNITNLTHRTRVE